MLTKLTVQNFRSLEKIDVPLGRLTAFVGPNGSGKTSVLRALSYLFGEAWPTIRTFRIPQDFTNFETVRSLEITGWFDPPYVHQDTLRKDHEVTAIRLSCKPYKIRGKWGDAGTLHVDHDPLDADGETPTVAVTPPRKGSQPIFKPLNVTGDLREHVRVLFIDHRRSLSQHLPHLRGSVLGRLLEPARRAFDRQDEFKTAYEAALEILRTDAVKEVEAKILETAKRMLGFLGREAGKSLNVGFGFADPANPFGSLRLEYRENGRGIPGDELGLGIQSAVVVGIFEALRQLGGGVQTLVIEEPEMYLHPQAQRYFYRLLCEMVETKTCQVIYATHSPIFADVNRYEAQRLVRRPAGGTSSMSYVKPPDLPVLAEERQRQKLAGRFDPTRNEVLFATKALLVEGHGDRVAALSVAEKLQTDVDAEGIAIVDCGGKSAIPLLVRVCRALDIPFVVLHDEDVWPIQDATDPAKQEEENKQHQQLNKRIADAISGAGGLYIAKPSLEAMLGIGRAAKDKPQKIIEKLQAMSLDRAPAPLVEATKAVLPLGVGKAS